MRLSKPKADDRQRRLFTRDLWIRSKGEARWAAGDFFERATADVCGGVQFRTDSRAEICPDVRIREGLFAESKSIGQSGTVILYVGRVEKDQRFMRLTGSQVCYWLWRHKFPVLKAASYCDLHEGLAENLLHLTVVSAEVLQEVLRGRATRVVNTAVTKDGSRLGYGNAAAGYGIGWTLPVNLFDSFCRKLPGKLSLQTRGVWLQAPVQVSNPEFAEFFQGKMTPPGCLF